MLIKIFKYLHFIIRTNSVKGHRIHSPFVYDLMNRVLVNKDDNAFNQLRIWRKDVMKDNTLLDISVFGAGSKYGNKNRIKAGKLSKISGLPHKYGILLYNLIREFRPATVIELGTGLGISTGYMALARSETRIFTVEGSEDRSETAKRFLEKLNINNVNFIKGDFAACLPSLLQKAEDPLLLFIDGDHRFDSTLRYFKMILKYANEHTIIIIDDIHWSDEMERAWEMISGHHATVLSMDLFRCGLVFFRK